MASNSDPALFAFFGRLLASKTLPKRAWDPFGCPQDASKPFQDEPKSTQIGFEIHINPPRKKVNPDLTRSDLMMDIFQIKTL